MKEVGDEVEFLHADKHQCFLQIDTVFFDDCVRVCLGMHKV